jgi:hypothetical protein
MKAIWRDMTDLWFGSWNSSPAASQQSNYVCVMDGVPGACAHFGTALDDLWSFISQNEQAYQIRTPAHPGKGKAG